MSISPISAAGLGQYVLASSDSSQLQQTLHTLEQSLSLGDLNGAQTAFQLLQQLNQGLENSSGSNSSSNTQLTNDLVALGSALGSGDLATAQSAFATVEGDLKSASSPALTVEANLASQSEQLVQGLLSTLDASTGSSSTSDLLASVEAAKSGLNVLA